VCVPVGSWCCSELISRGSVDFLGVRMRMPVFMGGGGSMYSVAISNRILLRLFSSGFC
jgi:hypothetical protein